jgi:hypothetical protein
LRLAEREAVRLDLADRLAAALVSEDLRARSSSRSSWANVAARSTVPLFTPRSREDLFSIQ